MQVWGQPGLHSKTLPQRGGGEKKSMSLLQLVNVRNVSNLTCPESNTKTCSLTYCIWSAHNHHGSRRVWHFFYDPGKLSQPPFTSVPIIANSVISKPAVPTFRSLYWGYYRSFSLRLPFIPACAQHSNRGDPAKA